MLPRHWRSSSKLIAVSSNDVRARYPGDEGRVARVSLIEEGAARQVRMAHLAIVGSHSTNGVAALHSDLVKKQLVPDFAAMFPERFNNKTNGVTPRRWLLSANPPLANAITEAIGDKLDLSISTNCAGLNRWPGIRISRSRSSRRSAKPR